MKMKAKKDELPIEDFRQEILQAVAKNSVVVITAETGAGKSTQVPQYLLEEGYDLVVTQPRRLAARMVATRVAEEIGEQLGGIVGFRTAVDRKDSAATRCLFCTDGLALVRELMGQNKGILVLDEVHEWNENMEVLVAWAKRQIELGADLKVVLMSATLEAEKLASFFCGAPVILVPGRLFPVEEKQPTCSNLVDEVAALVRDGHNVLVFQPGKIEIAMTCEELEQMQVNAVILPLHGELTLEDQAKCFKHYGLPKVVVSTNVAQTSVTIDDISAVVDSGVERRIELVDGVEGLYLKPISLADSRQRKGRAGRTKAGIYFDYCSSVERREFPVAEILRKRLDQTVLRLAIAGFDMEELEFFHQPSKSEIHDAKRALMALGCMEKDGSVTNLGLFVNRLPVSVKYARMLVEADRLGVVNDVIIIAAILEVDGIIVPPPSLKFPERPDWREMVPNEHESDVMGQLAVWKLADSMSQEELRKKGISTGSFKRAKELCEQLSKAVKQYFRLSSTGSRNNILKSVCAGMVDHLYQCDQGRYQNGESVSRELDSASLIKGAEWVVGNPFDLQIKTSKGEMTLNLIRMVSKIDLKWLSEVSPQLIRENNSLDLIYDRSKDKVLSTSEVYFKDRLISSEVVDDVCHPQASHVLASWLASLGPLSETNSKRNDLKRVMNENHARQARAQALNDRSGEKTFKVYSQSELSEFYLRALKGARRISEVKDPKRLLLPPLNEVQIDMVMYEQPNSISILGVQVRVEYILGNTPRICLSTDMISNNRWLDLPDEGICLPNGRPVKVAVNIGFWVSFDDTDIHDLKARLRDYFNGLLWDKWSKKPEIGISDPRVEGAQIPFVTVVYGKCVMTGENLIAYGTLTPNLSRNYSNESYFKVKWTKSEKEARESLSKSKAFLNIKQNELRREASRELKNPLRLDRLFGGNVRVQDKK